MSLDIGFDTILLIIATIIQCDSMHISAKMVYNLLSQFTIIE